MKNKKVYIGISAIILGIICIMVSIFYIKSKNEVKTAEFVKTNENAKEAMISKEENAETEEVTNEKVENLEETSNEEVENLEETSNEENEVEDEVKNEENTVVEEATEENKETVVKQETKKAETKTTETEKTETVAKKEFTVTDSEKTMYVTATSLNVREGPETTYNKIGSLKNSAEVSVTGIVDGFGWYRISYNGKVGYVDGTYLSETKPVVETKTVETTTSSSTSSGEVSTVDALIIINSRNNTLRYYVNGQLSRSYSCATGKSSTPTPQGKCQVVQKIVNRPYYKGGIAGGDPRNPLGKRWMGLNLAGTSGDTYGIHGTNNESSIGTNASAGCIRMHNEDVESFYDVVSIGTTVIIKNTTASDKEIAAGYGIYIE